MWLAIELAKYLALLDFSRHELTRSASPAESRLPSSTGFSLPQHVAGRAFPALLSQWPNRPRDTRRNQATKPSAKASARAASTTSKASHSQLERPVPRSDIIETIRPKGEKISPIAGFKRIFSMKQVVELLKSVLKITLLSWLLYYVIRDSISPYMNSLACGVPCILDKIGRAHV